MAIVMRSRMRADIQALAAGTVVATLFALVLGMLVPPAVIILSPGDAGYPFSPPADDRMPLLVVELAILAALGVCAYTWEVLVQHRPLREILGPGARNDWAVFPGVMAMVLVSPSLDNDWPTQTSVGAEPGQIAFVGMGTNAAAQMTVRLLVFWTVFAAIDLTRRAVARPTGSAEAVM